MDGSVTTLLVGDDAVELHVHEKLLRAHSTFFDAALSHSWIEAQQRRIALPEDKVATLEVYVQYLYTGNIFIKSGKSELKLEHDSNHPEYFVLADLYVLGEKVGNVRFRNAVINAFISRMQEAQHVTESGKHHCCPIATVVDTVYQGTRPNSPARRLMVDVHLKHGGEHWIVQDAQKHNKEFLMDLTRALLRDRKLGPGAWKLSREDYLEAQ